MTSSARLYERLGQIPSDAEDPECLEDVVVCAFGAFERYYVCWKTRDGAYRQDGHDLPPDLEDFLFAKASKRDFASLQVVFGRGNEFFASDKNGKLDFKEPEPEKKEATPEELEEKRALRRSKTMSFIRTRSDESNRHNSMDWESQSHASSRRGSLINGRPPSLSLSFRSNSDASLHTLNSQLEPRASIVSHTRPGSDSSLGSQLWSRPSSTQTTIPSRPSSDSFVKADEATNEAIEHDKLFAPPPIPANIVSTKRLRPLSMSFKGSLIPRIPEGKQVPQESPSSPPPLPPVPPVPKIHSLTVAESAKLETGKMPSASSVPPKVGPLQLKQKAFNQAPSTRSISPSFQLPEQTDSLIPFEYPYSALSLAEVKTTVHTSPIKVPSAQLSLYISDSSIVTTPISSATPPSSDISPLPPTLSIQIISTAVQTSPISPAPTPTPLPPALSMHFTAFSTTPTSPPPHFPVLLPESTPIPATSTSTSTQTSPLPSPLRTALRIDTSAAASFFPQHTYSFSTSSSALDIETPQDYYEPPPVFMGRMLEYYSKPGYQLGASLFGGYCAGEVMVHEEGGLTDWERANGRGY